MNFGRILVSLMQVRLAGTECEAGVGNWQSLILMFVKDSDSKAQVG